DDRSHAARLRSRPGSLLSYGGGRWRSRVLTRLIRGLGRVTLYLRACEWGWPVMTGPQGPAAAGRDLLRAGHAEREQAIESLKDAFVDGRLTMDELDARAGRALAARTCAELAALTADIPPAARPAHSPALARRWPLAKAA